MQTAQVTADMNAAFAALGPAPAPPAGSGPTPTLAQRTKQLRRDHPQLAALLQPGSGAAAGGSSGSGALGRAGAAGSGGGAPAAQLAPPLAGTGGNYSWGSAAMPWEVAAAGQAFVRDHVRVESALLYIRWAHGRAWGLAGGQAGAGLTTGVGPALPGSGKGPQHRLPQPPQTRPLLPRRDLLKAYAGLQRFKPRPVSKSVCYTGARLLEAFGHPYPEDAKKVAAAYPWLVGYDGGCTEAEAKWGAF